MSTKRKDGLHAGTIELAALLGVTRQTIAKWRRLKRIPQPKKVGIKSVYFVPDVIAAVRANRLSVDEITLEVIEAL